MASSTPEIVVPPFTCDGEGLKVKGHARETGDQLYDLLVAAEVSPSPAEDESAGFFAAQATHYGLEHGDTEQTGRDALVGAIRQQGHAELEVPEAIADLERKMASLFERRQQIIADESELREAWAQKTASDLVNWVPSTAHSGAYDIECQTLDELYACKSDHCLWISRAPSDGHLYVEFDFVVLSGTMRSCRPFDATDDRTVELRWCGAPDSTGPRFSRLNEVEMTLLPGGKLEGDMYWDGLGPAGGSFGFYGTLDAEGVVTVEDAEGWKRAFWGAFDSEALIVEEFTGSWL